MKNRWKFGFSKTFDNESLSPSQFLKIAQSFSDRKGTILLFSAGDRLTYQKSFLFLFPFEVLHIDHSQAPWEQLQSSLSTFHYKGFFPEWVGFFSYEMGAYSDLDKKISLTESYPLAYFQRSAVVFSLDHHSKKLTLFINREGMDFVSTEEKRLIEDFVKGNLQHYLERNDIIKPSKQSLECIQPFEPREKYREKIEKVKKWINEGEIYQLNLSQKILFQGSCDPFLLFEKLVEKNPASFFSFLNIDPFVVVCSSPERFLKKEGQFLEARPIKGTMARGVTLKQDQEQRRKLITSSKERAELLMITDLMRNDLGKISQPGSVQVHKLCKCESYSNVFHLLSVITSKALSEMHPLDIIRHCFPGGSITGCPKLKAMEFIHILEKRERNVYTGSIGYFSANGDFDFNIAIRTIILKNDQFNIQLGGAIVADSDSDCEYDELLAKGQSIFEAINRLSVN